MRYLQTTYNILKKFNKIYLTKLHDIINCYQKEVMQLLEIIELLKAKLNEYKVELEQLHRQRDVLNQRITNLEKLMGSAEILYNEELRKQGKVAPEKLKYSEMRTAEATYQVLKEKLDISDEYEFCITIGNSESTFLNYMPDKQISLDSAAIVRCSENVIIVDSVGYAYATITVTVYSYAR